MGGWASEFAVSRARCSSWQISMIRMLQRHSQLSRVQHILLVWVIKTESRSLDRTILAGSSGSDWSCSVDRIRDHGIDMMAGRSGSDWPCCVDMIRDQGIDMICVGLDVDDINHVGHWRDAIRCGSKSRVLNRDACGLMAIRRSDARDAARCVVNRPLLSIVLKRTTSDPALDLLSLALGALFSGVKDGSGG